MLGDTSIVISTITIDISLVAPVFAPAQGASIDQTYPMTVSLETRCRLRKARDLAVMASNYTRDNNVPLSSN